MVVGAIRQIQIETKRSQLIIRVILDFGLRFLLCILVFLDAYF